MDLFGRKKRRLKKEKARQLALEKQAEEKRQKEIEAKIKINKTLCTMKSQLKKVEKLKANGIKKAREAKSTNNEYLYNLQKQTIKMCLSKEKYLNSMIGNFEIAIQMNEMRNIISDFVDSMGNVAGDLKNTISIVDIAKAQKAYEEALANNQDQYSALDSFLNEAANSIESFNGIDSEIDDDEIDQIIDSEVIKDEQALDQEIDKKINLIQNKINS